MTIDELNKLLSEKKPDGIVKAEMTEIVGTAFLDDNGDTRINLTSDNRWVSGCYPLGFSNDFFKLVAPYADTPVNERKPEKKYNILFFRDIAGDGKDEFMNALYKFHGGYMVMNFDAKDKHKPDYQFTKAEINDIIKCRPKYEDVIKAAMVEVED